MAWRAVPSVTTRRIAPARKSACGAGQNLHRRIIPRIALVPDPPPLRHTPSRRDGRRHARHLERRYQHRTLPIRRERQRLAQFHRVARGDAELRSGIGQLLRAHIVYPQLREICIARDGDGAPHIQRAVGMVADIVFNGPVPARDHVARAPVGKRAALERAMLQFRIRRAARQSP